MKITKLKLTNFRNFNSLELDFKDFNEIIRNNGWGKSNIADSIAWILTGHLFDGSSDIESIKPKKNTRALVEVELHLDSGLWLSKTYKENWTKTRGSNDYELKGHTTSYYINGLEMTQGVYEDQLYSHVGIDKTTYHLLLDPTYFGLKLDWKQRRSLINEIVGDISFNEIIANDPIFTTNVEATSELHSNLINFNNKVDLTKKSFTQNLNKLKKEQSELEGQILGLNLITTTIDEPTYHAYKEANQLAQERINALTKDEDRKQRIKNIEFELEILRDSFKNIESQEFTGVKPIADTCSNCGFTLNQDEFNQKLQRYESISSDFVNRKAKQLGDISTKGRNLKTELEELKGLSSETTNGYLDLVKTLDSEIATRETSINHYQAWKLAQDKIKEVENKLELVRKAINKYELLSDLLGFYVSSMLSLLDSRLNDVFGDIKFRLIEPNIKEGSWNEVCEVLDGLVPYDRTNTASQIKIGVKLIQAIRKQKAYPTIPIIIDNAESVVDRNFGSDTQFICLIAGKENSNE